MVCPYTSCIDCSISRSNGTHAGPDLVNDSGACMCVVVVMVNVGGPDSLQLALVVFFYLQLTNVFNLDPLQLAQVVFLYH